MYVIYFNNEVLNLLILSAGVEDFNVTSVVSEVNLTFPRSKGMVILEHKYCYISYKMTLRYLRLYSNMHEPRRDMRLICVEVQHPRQVLRQAIAHAPFVSFRGPRDSCCC